MKKLHYLFAALLGGATLSLSSCIDTTEPAGIEAMRTSKAEWLKAKAAYENAEAQLKLVEVERKKILLELERIDLELARMQSEAAKDSLLMEREKMLLEMNAKVAEAEKSYLESILAVKLAMFDMQDQAVAKKLEEYELALDTAIAKTRGAQQDLANAKFKKTYLEMGETMLFLESELVDRVKAEEELANLKIYVAKLDSLDKLDEENEEALYAQLAKYEDEIVALTAQEAELLKEIEDMKYKDPEVAKKVAELTAERDTLTNSKKAKQQTTLVKAKDLNETMTEWLYGHFKDNDMEEANKLFEVTNNPYAVKMVGDYAEELELDALPDLLTHNYTQWIKTAVEQSYTTAYSELGLGDDVKFDKDGTPFPVYAEKVKAELARLAKDKDYIVNTYNTTYEDWGKAYAEYFAAAEKFKGHESNDADFEALESKVAAYNGKSNKTSDEATALYNSIKDFAEKLNKVDGKINTTTKSFINTYAILTDVGDPLFQQYFEQFNTYVQKTSLLTIVGRKLPTYGYDDTYYLQTYAQAGGTLAKFLILSNTLFGTSFTDIQAAVIPVLQNGKYVMPEGISYTRGAYGQYIAATDPDATAIFNDINKWATVYAEWQKIADKATADLQAIDDKIDNLQKQIDEKNKVGDKTALWKKELDCYMLKGKKEVFSKDNPYRTIADDPSVPTQKDIIEDLKGLVQSAIDNNGTYKYACFNPTTGKTEVYPQTTTTDEKGEKSEGLKGLIESVESDIEDLEYDLALLDWVEKVVDEYGVGVFLSAYAAAEDNNDDEWENWADFKKWLDSSDKFFDEVIEAEIKDCEEKLARCEDEVDRIKAQIAALIAAYEAGDFAVTLPDADEPADEPTTDESTTDEPTEGEGESESGEGEA